MKVSISLPDEDIEFLDRYAREHGVGSRSAAVRRAVRLLRSSQLGADYAAAWREWSEGGEAQRWDTVVGDGLGAD